MQGFTFYKSYWETAQAIPDPVQRLAFLEAVISYTLEDSEPEELPVYAHLAFTAVRPSLNKSKARGTSARKEAAEPVTGPEGVESESKQNHNEDLISKPENKTKSNKIKRNQKEDLISKNDNQKKSNEIKSPTDTDTVTDTVTEKNNNVRPAAPVSEAQLDAEFEKLWGMYPKDRKRGKKKAAAAYKRARTRQKKPVDYSDVLIGINRYNAHIAARRIESRYILLGETYFNGEHWTDEYGIGTGGSGAQVSKWEQGVSRNDYNDEEFAEFERIAGAG